MERFQVHSLPADTWIHARVWRDPERPWELRLRPVRADLIEALSPFCESARAPGESSALPAARLSIEQLQELVDFSMLPADHSYPNEFLGVGTVMTITCPWDNCCALVGEGAYALLVDPVWDDGISVVL